MMMMMMMMMMIMMMGTFKAPMEILAHFLRFQTNLCFHLGFPLSDESH